MYHARIQDLPRSAKGHFRLSAVPMDRDHDRTCMPVVTLVLVEPAAIFGQPFPECRAFHGGAPVAPAEDVAVVAAMAG